MQFGRRDAVPGGVAAVKKLIVRAFRRQMENSIGLPQRCPEGRKISNVCDLKGRKPIRSITISTPGTALRGWSRTCCNSGTSAPGANGKNEKRTSISIHGGSFDGHGRPIDFPSGAGG